MRRYVCIFEGGRSCRLISCLQLRDVIFNEPKLFFYYCGANTENIIVDDFIILSYRFLSGYGPSDIKTEQSITTKRAYRDSPTFKSGSG